MVVVAGPCWQRWHHRLQKDGDFRQVTHGEALGSPSSAATAAATGGTASLSSREKRTSSTAALWLFIAAIIYMDLDDSDLMMVVQYVLRKCIETCFNLHYT